MPKGKHSNHVRGAAHVRFKHGLSTRTPLYRLWVQIRSRCHDQNRRDFKHYGGRGVRVCSQWDDFTQFEADVGPHPGGKLTLDRRDTNRDYEPGNVRWATRQTQARNRNYCTLDKPTADRLRSEYVRGVVKQSDLARKYGVSQSLVSKIVLWRNWI